ncbi:MAG TPA: hypothetical protein VGN34_18330 [Ktedonobacteraceae bacterium]|jgi:hypothetical protein
MSDYVLLQTYATCNPDTFQVVIQCYRILLERLGCIDQQVFSWLTELQWPTSDEDNFGDIYALPFAVTPTLSCDGMTVTLYDTPAVPSVEDPPAWLGFNLLFDTSNVHQDHSTVYVPGFGTQVWSIMRALANEFPEIGVYLTDEYQENHAWRALAENAGADPWAFDLAIFPRNLAEHFAEVPSGFQGTVLEKKFGFALQNRWQALPWQEAE